MASTDTAQEVTMSLPTLLDVPAACRELGDLSRAQLYRLIQAGELETTHLGRLTRVTGASLAAYVDRLIEAEQERHSGPPEAASWPHT
jgi:hypothetical protein